MFHTYALFFSRQGERSSAWTRSNYQPGSNKESWPRTVNRSTVLEAVARANRALRFGGANNSPQNRSWLIHISLCTTSTLQNYLSGGLGERESSRSFVCSFAFSGSDGDGPMATQPAPFDYSIHAELCTAVYDIRTKRRYNIDLTTTQEGDRQSQSIRWANLRRTSNRNQDGESNRIITGCSVSFSFNGQLIGSSSTVMIIVIHPL